MFALYLGLFAARPKQHRQLFSNSALKKLLQLRSDVRRLLFSESSRTSEAIEILDPVNVELLDRYQVEERYNAGTWQRQAYDDFTGISSQQSQDQVGAKSIVVHSRGRNICLVLLWTPPTTHQNVEDYRSSVRLKGLRELDPKLWPAKIPRDTLHRKWRMNFDGMETFFAVLTPAHQQRLSRHANSFAMMCQPRQILDIAFKDARYRESATRTVRGLVDKFDHIPRSPDISNYAVEETAENRQYFLLDQHERFECPNADLDVAAREGLS